MRITTEETKQIASLLALGFISRSIAIIYATSVHTVNALKYVTIPSESESLLPILPQLISIDATVLKLNSKAREYSTEQRQTIERYADKLASNEPDEKKRFTLKTMILNSWDYQE